MKSDKAKPTAHVFMPSHKSNHPAAPASAGTNEFPTKSHEADIALGEGKNYGAVNLKKHKVRDAKQVKGTQMAAQAEHARRENGNADPNGGW